MSLMALGLVPLQAVYHARLGHAEREPVLNFLLQIDVELRRQFLLLLGDDRPGWETSLEKQTRPPVTYARREFAIG